MAVKQGWRDCAACDDKSRDKLPVFDQFRFRHASFDYLKVDWKEIKLAMVDFFKIKI